MGLLGDNPDVSLLSDSQKQVSNKLGPILRSGIGRSGNPYDQGQIVPDLLPQYQQVQNLLGQSQGMNQNAQSFLMPFTHQLTQQTLPGAQQALQNIQKLGSPLMGSTLLGQGSTQNMLQRGVFNPIRQAMNPQDQMSGFGGMFAGSQAGTQAQQSGNLQSQQQQLQGQTQFQNSLANEQMQDQTAQMNLGRQSQQSQMQRALGQMNVQSGLAGSALSNQASMLPLQQALGIGGTLGGLQQQKQAQYNAGYQDWLRTLPENSPWTQLALQYIGTPSQQASGKSSTLAGVAGGAASGAAVGTEISPGWGTLIGGVAGGILGAF